MQKIRKKRLNPSPSRAKFRIPIGWNLRIRVPGKILAYQKLRQITPEIIPEGKSKKFRPPNNTSSLKFPIVVKRAILAAKTTQRSRRTSISFAWSAKRRTLNGVPSTMGYSFVSSVRLSIEDMACKLASLEVLKWIRWTRFRKRCLRSVATGTFWSSSSSMN